MGIKAPSLKSSMPTSEILPTFNSKNPAIEETENYRNNFAVVIKVNWMEWLWLSSKGYRRASFYYQEDNNFGASWIIL